MSTELEERIGHLEKQYNEYYKYVREYSSYLFDVMNWGDDGFDHDKRDFSEYYTHEFLTRMYHILCAYFETLGLRDYLQNFKDKYEDIIKVPSRATEFSSEPIEYGDTVEDLSLLIEWKRYLAPFSFFWEKPEKKENRKLLEFLESTNEILKITNTKVVIEENINSVMREMAKFYFAGVIPFSEGYFVHRFTKYKPDLIIRELGVAIEYKLIRSNKDIGPKLDELLIDAKRYSGNANNKECIAVLCLSTSVRKTKKEIKEDWNSMNFPSNWKLVIILDVSIESKQSSNYKSVSPKPAKKRSTK